MSSFEKPKSLGWDFLMALVVSRHYPAPSSYHSPPQKKENKEHDTNP
jgi:hypothetical protein